MTVKAERKDGAEDDAAAAAEVEAALTALQTKVDAACALIHAAGLSGEKQKRRHLDKLNWDAIRYLLIVEQWTATEIAARFQISPNSVWARCRRENWRRAGEGPVRDPVAIASDVNIATSMLGALSLYNLRPKR